MTGKIARIVSDKAFGFIHNNGTDYFFHKSGCITDFDRLQVGMDVEFEEEYSTKGSRAKNVTFTGGR